MAYGGSEAGGQIGATATARATGDSEPLLQPIPELKAMLNPPLKKWGQGLYPHPHGS